VLREWWGLSLCSVNKILLDSTSGTRNGLFVVSNFQNKKEMDDPPPSKTIAEIKSANQKLVAVAAIARTGLVHNKAHYLALLDVVECHHADEAVGIPRAALLHFARNFLRQQGAVSRLFPLTLKADLAFLRIMETINIDQAEVNLAQLLARVERGEEIVISDQGIAIAKLVPVRSGSRRRSSLGMDRGKLIISEDFNDPLPDDILAAFEGDEA
jgi:antitoxin (DNA-binding transcriptional repressor) of toxin-antitoxin stability system